MRARSRKLELSSAGRLGVPLVAQMVKDLPAIWEAQVWLLGQEDLLEKGMATHSSILAWRIPWWVTVTEAWWVIVHGFARSWI